MADILITILGAAAIIFIWVILYDSNRFVVRKHQVADSRIKKKARAIVLADLHNKRYGRENERLLEAIREQKPDFILVAGDLVTAKPGRSLKPAIQLLKELAQDYPIYYGNGNHEYRMKLYPKTYGDMARQYGQALGELGIDPLVNSRMILEEYGLAICGVEIDRELYRRFRIPKMPEDYMTGMLGEAPKDLYTVLLAHNPDYFPQYAAWGADMVLSGHVHGGVLRIPFFNRGVISPGLRLFPKYDGGIFKEGKSTMVLSRGLGMHTIYIRLFNPAELWVVEFEPEVTF
ncbi:MAG: metallophosphoesterase [Acetatifactor sp.]|nr:metallophosphoesterase [Acetatifactor sp.]